MFFHSGNLRERAGKLLSLFRSLENSGVLASHDARAARHILLANRLTLSYLCIAWPYFIVFALNGLEILAWSQLTMIAWLAMTILLNAKGWITTARINLALNMSVSITCLSLALGRGAGVHLLLLAAILVFLILFDLEREKKIVLAGIAVDSALFLGFQTLDFRIGMLYALDSEAEQSLRLVVSATTLLTFITGILHYLAHNARVENDLIAAREKALSADHDKTRLLATLGHEIRNPLNVIMGSAQLMEKSNTESNHGEYLANIRTSAKDLLAILTDVLDLSKIEAGKVKLESKPVQIQELAETALSSFLPQAAPKGLKLRLDADGQDFSALWGDPNRLKQILDILLANALKSTRSGTIVLRIRRAGGEQVRPRIRFEITDTEAGIAEEEQKEHYLAFRQSNDTTARAFGESRLDLILCKGLVELMGGSIGHRSRQGIGSTVVCILPFDAMSGMENPSPVPDAGEARLSLKGLRCRESAVAGILVVEDHPVNRMVLQSMLQAQGFIADEVSDGKQALEAIKARPYDLILMDCHMPVMDGIECTRRIRAMEGPSPMIIGITADTSTETRRHCLQAGMDQVLLKPLQEQELRKVLHPFTAAEKPDAPSLATPIVSEWLDVGRLNRLIQSTRLSEPVHRKKALEQFESDVQALRQALGEAWDLGGAKQLKESAHGLKGLCLTLGLGRLAEICKRIEGISTAEDSPDWSPVKSDFETVFEASLADLRRALKV